MRLILGGCLALAVPGRPWTRGATFAPVGAADVPAPECAAGFGQPVARRTRPRAGGGLGAARQPPARRERRRPSAAQPRPARRAAGFREEIARRGHMVQQGRRQSAA